MVLKDDYTTEEKKSKDAEKEKDKVVLSNDAYAICEFVEELTRNIRIGGKH